MSKLCVALISGAMVGLVLVMLSDMPMMHDVEHCVHNAKKAMKEQL